MYVLVKFPTDATGDLNQVGSYGCYQVCIGSAVDRLGNRGWVGMVLA